MLASVCNQYAITRAIPDSIADGLSMDKHQPKVSVAVAREQHDNYTQILHKILSPQNYIRKCATVPPSTPTVGPILTVTIFN